MTRKVRGFIITALVLNGMLTRGHHLTWYVAALVHSKTAGSGRTIYGGIGQL